jgi:hypothetical protein
MHLHETFIDPSACLKILFLAVGIAQLTKELTSHRMAQKISLSETSTILVVLVLLCNQPSGSVIYRRHVTFRAPRLSSTSDPHSVANLAPRSYIFQQWMTQLHFVRNQRPVISTDFPCSAG